MHKQLQTDDIDQQLRNSLWTALHETIYRLWIDPRYDERSQRIEKLFTRYWWNYFKRPSDQEPYFTKALEEVRAYFFSCSWNEVYDFLEFTTKNAEWAS